jgi:transmembrane sensor
MSIPKGEGVDATRSQVREAAVWLAMLRGPERTSRVELGFRRWVAEHPAHRVAFDLVSSAWDATEALPREPLPYEARSRREGFRHGVLRAGTIAAAFIVLLAVGIVWYLRTASVGTEIGEQRMLALEDGSRVFLNTNSRVVVRFDSHRRFVLLKQGEALFEVAKSTVDRPFIVQAGARTVTALGTRFVVRLDPSRTSVTLLDGRVAVADTASGSRSILEPARKQAEPVMLAPGDRVTLSEAAAPKLDSPSLDKVTAWRDGHVDLAEMSLAEAAAEMNRYSRVRILIEQPAAATLRVSGVFRTGDTESFVNAIAETYGLRVVAGEGIVTLTGRPKKSRAIPN